MNITTAELDGLLVLEPDVYEDERGWFKETWNIHGYIDAGIDAVFEQDNISYSRHGVIRGLHFQNPEPQGKLVSVLDGSVFDVAVDLRTKSASFGKWCCVDLSADNGLQLWIPPGFAHGFCVTSESAVFHYKCSSVYRREFDRCLRWDDPAIGIEWPVSEPRISTKDMAAPLLSEIDNSLLF